MGEKNDMEVQRKTSLKRIMREHRLQIIFMAFLFVVALIIMATIFQSINKTLKESLSEEMKEIVGDYTEKIEELEVEKQRVIETAFAVKNELLSKHYTRESRQYEDFMLNGTRIIVATYELEKLAVKDRMTNTEMRDYLSITFEGSKVIGADPYLFLAIDYVESKFNKNAVSAKDARGICQFVIATARMVANSYTSFAILQVGAFSWKKLYDPVYSKKLQLRYVRHLMEEFDGRVQWALFAYNYGPDHVYKYEWKKGEAVFVELSREKQNYSNNVLDFYDKITTKEK